MNARFVALAGLALCLGFGSAAPADQPAPQATPTPVNLPTLPPSTAVNPYVKLGIQLLTGVVEHQIDNNRNNSTGQVTYFRRFDMQVQTGSNNYRAIHLHQGTVINPRGESITQGQRVEVSGVTQSDGSLDANVITIDH